MTTLIQPKKRIPDRIPEELWTLLPEALRSELLRVLAGGMRIEEIRLRCGRYTRLTVQGGGVTLCYLPDRDAMDELVLRLCKGSVYAFRDCIVKGFIPVSGGVRVGICGRASLEGGAVVGIYDVDGLNIRLPSGILPVGREICRLIRETGRGVLIYAPPGEGKTTLLRSAVSYLSSEEGGMRVALVDSREELALGLDSPKLSLDVLTGYPRSLGIEIALRTMNPQLIVCDEIGEEEEAESILRAAGGGVPFLASTHGGALFEMLSRGSIQKLHRNGVFGTYAGIRRRAGETEYAYTITKWEDADGLFASGGNGDGSF